MNQELLLLRHDPKKIGWILLAVTGLAFSFLFQEVDVLSILCQCEDYPRLRFVIRKVLRVLINDSCMLLILHCWFNDPKITRLAWSIQLIDTLILLPVYLTLKLTLEGDKEISSPLLSQLHRMIVNPTLMILIIPGVYFQRLKRSAQ